MIRRTMKVITRTRFPRPFPVLSSIGSKSMKMTKLSHWVTQRRFSRGIAWFLFSAILLTGTAYAFLTDSGAHAPPTIGPYAYNTFMPGTPGFPAVGGTYTDPVFGSTIKRLTNVTGSVNFDDIYAKHQANANGTLAFRTTVAEIVHVINVSTGAIVYSNQPTGIAPFEMHWDALDPGGADRYHKKDLPRHASDKRRVAQHSKPEWPLLHGALWWGQQGLGQ